MSAGTVDINYPIISKAKEIAFPQIHQSFLPCVLFSSIQQICVGCLRYSCFFCCWMYRDESQFLSFNPKSIEIHKGSGNFITQYDRQAGQKSAHTYKQKQNKTTLHSRARLEKFLGAATTGLGIWLHVDGGKREGARMILRLLV